jgi:hypothetical protein
MQTLGTILFFLVCLGFALSPVHGQSTAFTYQGRLNDGTNPANGSYEMRFGLFGDKDAGEALAVPITNAPIQVSNGIFAVTLDWGGAVFAGPNRWLEIAVRTNGAENFVVLAPRQALSPVPYALYAASASNLLGTVTLTSNLMAGANLTNATVSGSFAGDGSGLTNLVGSNAVQNYTLGADSLDYTTWCALNQGYGFLANNLNRNGWTNTLSVLRTNGPLSILFLGNGWVQDGVYFTFFDQLASVLPVRGAFGQIGMYSSYAVGINQLRSRWFDVANSQDSANYSRFLNGNFVAITNAKDTMLFAGSDFAKPVTNDLFSFRFIGQPTAGQIAIFTNFAAGYWSIQSNSWGLVCFTNLYQPFTNPVFVCWTNAAGPAPTYVLVSNTAAIKTSFDQFQDGWDSTQGNGFSLGIWGHQGMGGGYLFFNDMLCTNIVGPFLSRWSPTLILIFSSQSTNDSSYRVVKDMLKTWTPQSDVVLTGMWPYPGLTQSQMANFQNWERRNCYSNHWAYFNPAPYFGGSVSNMYARGFISSDGAHLSLLGYRTYSTFLFNWMGLFDYSSGAQ